MVFRFERRPRRSLLFLTVFLLSLLLAACDSCDFSSSENTSDLKLLPGTDLIVTATVVDNDARVEGVGSSGYSRLVVAVADRVLWQDENEPSIPLPDVGEQLVIRADGDWKVPEGPTVLFISHSDGGDTLPVEWSMKLAVDPDSGELIEGIDPPTRTHLANDLLLNPGETSEDRLDALVDLVDLMSKYYLSIKPVDDPTDTTRMWRVLGNLA
ncbi:MAG: hypothetical protein ACR2NL_06220 [Acidimicrobiia bacterium]